MLEGYVPLTVDTWCEHMNIVFIAVTSMYTTNIIHYALAAKNGPLEKPKKGSLNIKNRRANVGHKTCRRNSNRIYYI